MTGILKVDAIQNNTGTSVMNFNANGIITKPNQPSFEVSVPNSHAATPAGTTYWLHNWGKTHHNVGGHMNLTNGRFTAPVSGSYFFHAIIMNPTNIQNPHLAFGINNSPNGGGGTYVNNDMWVHPADGVTGLIQIAHVIYLNANDFVRTYIYAYTSSDIGSKGRCYFGGYLIG